MNSNIKLKLIQGKYSEVKKICEQIDMSKVRDEMMNIAYETEGICVYSFVQYMIYTTGNNEWIKIALDVLLNPLCFIEGAYSVALFHVRELLKRQKSIENLEMLLFFYNIPEKLISKEEAVCIADEILKMEPTNEIALKVVLF